MDTNSPHRFSKRARRMIALDRPSNTPVSKTICGFENLMAIYKNSCHSVQLMRRSRFSTIFSLRATPKLWSLNNSKRQASTREGCAPGKSAVIISTHVNLGGAIKVEGISGSRETHRQMSSADAWASLRRTYKSTPNERFENDPVRCITLFPLRPPRASI